MKKLLFVVLALLLPALAFAVEKPKYMDWTKRISVDASSGYLRFKEYGSELDPWRGADLGLALKLSLYERVGVCSSYQHGFPFQDKDPHESQLHIAADVRLFPGTAYKQELRYAPSPWELYIGSGVMWRGEDTIRDWSGSEAHAMLCAGLNERIGAFASYSHAFTARAGRDTDFDFVRAGLSLKVWR